LGPYKVQCRRATGLFRPAKQLRDKIEARDTLGIVTNPFGKVLHTLERARGHVDHAHAQLWRVAAGDAVALVI
jgi:predicted deacylase